MLKHFNHHERLRQPRNTGPLRKGLLSDPPTVAFISGLNIIAYRKDICITYIQRLYLMGTFDRHLAVRSEHPFRDSDFWLVTPEVFNCPNSFQKEDGAAFQRQRLGM